MKKHGQEQPIFLTAPQLCFEPLKDAARAVEIVSPFQRGCSHDRAQRVSAIKRAVIDLGRGGKLAESLAQLTGGRISHQHVVHRANCLCLSLLLNIAGELGQILSRCHMRRGRPDVAGLHEPEGEITLQGGAQGDIVVGLAQGLLQQLVGGRPAVQAAGRQRLPTKDLGPLCAWWQLRDQI